MNKLNDNEDKVWDIYIHSLICDSQLMWSGPNAVTLPLATPIHVITAHNPFEELLSDEENKHRNNALLSELNKCDAEIKPVTGQSPSGDWQEKSFAVYGLTREQACEIARKYQQRAIFELTVNELLVIDASNHAIVRRRPR